MPPHPAYNWLCVLASTAEVLANAARYRAAQVSASASSQGHGYEYGRSKRRKTMEEEKERVDVIESTAAAPTSTSAPAPSFVSETGTTINKTTTTTIKIKTEAKTGPPLKRVLHEHEREHEREIRAQDPILKPQEREQVQVQVREEKHVPVTPESKLDQKPETINPDTNTTTETQFDTTPSPSPPPAPSPQPQTASTRTLHSSKVPSSRIGRLFHYGGLAASLGFGAASEIVRRGASGSGSSANTNTNGTGQEGSVMMTEANINRLVSKLSQMRGAALKLGQFMSIQDTHMLPLEIDKIFRRVQDSAHYMPDWQMEQVLSTSLSPTLSPSTLFTSFDRIPFAAASIGQVHLATLAPSFSPTGKEARVAVKIQFPGVGKSIESDIAYLRWALRSVGLGGVLPRGLFLDRTIEVMKQELADECDYTREASFIKLFGDPTHLGNDGRYKVPWVWEGSTREVLVMEWVGGKSVGEFGVVGGGVGEEGEGDVQRENEGRKRDLAQKDRNDIAAWILELCLKELFEFRAMQTDPNWTNFLWNSQTRQIELVDFGATRTYTKEFMDMWFSLLQAAANDDREGCKQWSLKMGYLTGEESEEMLNAHVQSMSLLAAPFKASTPQPFAFGPHTEWARITKEIRDQIPVMLRERQTPPPRETYSLNRKLSGSFLLASRLGASFDTKAVWDKVVGKYKLG